MNTTLPFSVTPFTNASGSMAYRVSGYWQGERTRKNFSERALADAFCNTKNAESMTTAAAPKPSAWSVVQTTLTERDVRNAEAAHNEIAGRWPLRDVLRAGIDALDARLPSRPVGELVTEWLTLIELEVSDKWFSDLKHRVSMFAKDHPKLTTQNLNRAVVRAWLDGLPHAQQSKANMRNAVHRFGGWLVERGHVRENPASEIRITRRRSGALQADQPLPSIFTPLQCEALLRACELGACRRLLGWMAGCLFTGVRPESEAPRTTWAELNLETAELSVMGRKRGAKPRVINLQPAAIQWLTLVKADQMEKPMLYSRRAKTRAIELANAWLAERHPAEKPIVWDEDITRHTFASYRSPQIPVHELAAEMGNSPGTIYGHYRNPRPAAEVKAFWATAPKP